MRKIIFITSVFCYFLLSAKAQKTTIEGTLTNADNVKMVHLDDIMTGSTIDSAKVSRKGKFELSTNLKEVSYYKLSFDEYNYLLLVLQPNEKITIQADMQNVLEPIISGSPASEMFYTTYNGLRGYEKKLDSLQKAIEKQKKQYLAKIIRANSSSPASVLFLEYFDVSEDFDIYNTLDSALYPQYPDLQLIAEMHNKVQSARSLAKGQIPPDIALPTPAGDTVRLSSLKGKVVLVDFWASWCGPCRMENPKLVEVYAKYKNKGFEIYGVSFDETRDNWVEAISHDNLTWLQVSDLMYWESPVATMYGIQSIPFNVLLDKDGKIIAKGLRGNDLEEKLKEIFD